MKEVTIGVNTLAVLCIAAQAYLDSHDGGDEVAAVQMALTIAASKIRIVKKDALAIQHLDGNPLNNELSNLRVVTLAENSR